MAWHALNFSAVGCGDIEISLGLAGHQPSSAFSEKLLSVKKLDQRLSRDLWEKMELFPGRSKEEREAPKPKAHEPPGNKRKAGSG